MKKEENKFIELFNNRKKVFGEPGFGYLGLDILNMRRFFFGDAGESMRNPRLLSSCEGRIDSIALSYAPNISEAYFEEILKEIIQKFSEVSVIYVFGIDLSKKQLSDKIKFIPGDIYREKDSWIQDYFFVLKDDTKNFIINNFENDADGYYGDSIDGYISIRSFFNIPMGNLIVGDDFVLIGEDALTNQLNLWQNDEYKSFYSEVSKFCLKLAKEKSKELGEDIPQIMNKYMLIPLLEVLFEPNKKWYPVRNLKSYDEKLMTEVFNNLPLFPQINFQTPDVINPSWLERIEVPDILKNKQEHLALGIELTNSSIKTVDTQNDASMFFEFFQYHLDWFITYGGYSGGKRILYLGYPEFLGNRSEDIEAFELLYEIWLRITELRLRRDIFDWKTQIVRVPIPYYLEKLNNQERIVAFSYNNCLVEVMKNTRLNRILLPSYESIENEYKAHFQMKAANAFKNNFDVEILGVDFNELVLETKGSLHCSVKILNRIK